MLNSRLLLNDLRQLFLDNLIGRAYSYSREVYLPHWVVGRIKGGDRWLEKQVRLQVVPLQLQCP